MDSVLQEVRLQETSGFYVNQQTLCSVGDSLLAQLPLFTTWQRTLVRSKKKDGSPVSNADKNIQRCIAQLLAHVAPEILMRGEEDEEATWDVGELPNLYWVVDPIDGTRFFEAGMYEWCISIALIHNGVAIGAIVLQPALHECFVAVKGQGVMWRTSATPWQRFVPDAPEVPMLIVPTSRSVMCNPVYNKQATYLIGMFESTCSKPSVLAALEIVRKHAWGWASLFQPWLWDIAAGSLLVQEMGGVTLTANGEQLSLNTSRMPAVVFTRSRAEADKIILALQEI